MLRLVSSPPQGDDDENDALVWRIECRSQNLDGTVEHIKKFRKANKLEKHCTEPTIYRMADGKAFIKMKCARPIIERITRLPNVLRAVVITGERA